VCRPVGQTPQTIFLFGGWAKMTLCYLWSVFLLQVITLRIAIYNKIKYYLMKYSIFFYQLIYFLFLCSCSNHKQAESISLLKHQTIDSGENFIGYGGFLAFCQGNIVGMEMSQSMQPFFCIRSNGSSQTLFRFGNKGQGPDDFLRPLSIQYINNQTVGTFDIMSKTYSEFTIPNENEELKIDKKIRFQAQLTQIIKTACNQYIGLSFDEGMFLLADSTGMPINTYFEYPYQDENERRLTVRSNAYQGTLAVNPSKNKFVYSSFQGEIIHFYTIENSGIKTVAKIENEYPVYKKRSDGEDGVMMGAEGKNGYIAAYATEKFVYAIFSGKTVLEQHGNANFEGKLLRIFDWNGVPVKEYELDVLCSYLCVSDDDSKIWAVASTPEIAMVSFELENTVENKPDGELQKIRELVGNNSFGSNAVRYAIEVKTENGKDNEATKRLLDSIKILLPGSSSGGNIQDIKKIYPDADIQIDTLADNMRKIRITLKDTNK
jgi:hypothetical protein